MTALPHRWLRRIILLLLIASVAASRPAAADNGTTERWLFIGNSLIQGHEVQDLAAMLASSLGPRVVAERCTLGGATLKEHVDRTDAGAPLPQIANHRWDIVVLQPNGQLAMTERPAGLEPYALRPARQLVEAARARGARPVLMMTWSYRGQDHTRPALQRNFTRLAEELAVDLAPVGVAFARAEERLPSIELLQSDGIHTTLAGAYLAAAVLYATIEGTSPVGGDAPEGLEPTTARRLQGLAWSVARPSLDMPTFP